MALTLSDFPRPCFYKDLTRLDASGRLQSALILGDVAPGDLCTLVAGWHRLLPRLRMLVVSPSPVPADVRETLQVLPGVALLAEGTGDGVAAAIVPLLTSELPRQGLALPEIILTCSPYDSFGTVVKQLLETEVLKIMEATGAVFVVHDPVYGVARMYDRSLLANRLRARPRRLGLYRNGVRLLLWLTGWLSRLPAPGWRPVR